jgi:hypothetical protein
MAREVAWDRARVAPPFQPLLGARVFFFVTVATVFSLMRAASMRPPTTAMPVHKACPTTPPRVTPYGSFADARAIVAIYIGSSSSSSRSSSSQGNGKDKSKGSRI